MLADALWTHWSTLAPKGWADKLRSVGLNITATTSGELIEQLNDEFTVDRTQAGFEDFAVARARGLTPGALATSVLYHAWASPHVHPTADNQPGPAEAYPSLEALDVLENLVFAQAAKSLDDFPGAVVAVFALQYRGGERAAHGAHADVAFARTGVARVGTSDARWVADRRSYLNVPENESGVAVMPARYAAFLAVRSRGPGPWANMSPARRDVQRTWLRPVHKLFDGRECLQGLDLEVGYVERHVNEKLRRAHTRGGLRGQPATALAGAPFVRTSTDHGLVELQRVGSSVVLVPEPAGSLTRPARLPNGRVATFDVPPNTEKGRFWSSLELGTRGTARPAPEYINIRHEVLPGDGQETIRDLNELDEGDFRDRVLVGGGYKAAHFEDDACEGFIRAQVEGLGERASVPAYSLVTAPDYFPLVDQTEIQAWLDGLGGERHFRQGGPSPLSAGRHRVNPDIQDAAGAGVFDADQTLTAVLSPPAHEDRSVSRVSRMTSWLPDAAANVFAPGWDVSLDADGGDTFLAAYGLGSPFPEDAKLCAALNSFWPAAAPDASRTFGVQASPTAMPLMDDELGRHPDHPRARAGATSEFGWDGEFGPFYRAQGQVVDFADRNRADQTARAAANEVRVSRLADLTAEEVIQRMDALRTAIRVLPPSTDGVSETPLFLVQAEQVEDWAARPDRLHSSLTGPGYLYDFAVCGNEVPSSEKGRVRAPVRHRLVCELAGRTGAWQVAFRVDSGPVQTAR